MTVYAFVDDSGVERLRGTIEPAPGGSQPTTREELSGNGVVIAGPTAFEWLTWNSTAGPDAVLDISTPAHPTVGVAGVYCVAVTVRSGAGSNDGTFDIGLFLDRSGFNASQTVFVFTDATSGLTSDVTIAFAWYIPAGGKVEVGVTYSSLSASNANCSIVVAHIQRLS